MYLLKLSFFVFVSTALFSCKFFQQGPVIDEDPIARVNDSYLYPADVSHLNTSGLNVSDSIKMVKSYIDSWVQDQLMVDVAKKNLSEYQKTIEDKMKNYENELIIYLYEKELILQKLDTFVSPSEIQKYYNEFENNFIASSDLYNINYIILPKGIEETNSIRNWFQKSDDKSRANLDEWCDNNIILCQLDNNSWLNIDEAAVLFPLNKYYTNRLKSVNYHFELQDSTHTYMFKTVEYVKAGEQAPLDYVQKNIENILLNKRKVKLIKNTYAEIYKEGVKKNAFQIYN